MGLASYTIEIGDEEITFEGPDNLSQKDIEQLADQYLKTAKPGQQFRHAQYGGERVVAPEDDSSAVGAYVRGVNQGGTFNFGDEIAAGANAAIPGLAWLDNLSGIGGEQQGPFNGSDFWSRFEHNMDEMQGKLEADREHHNTARILGNVSGALATLPAAEATAARLPQALRVAAEANPIKTAIVAGTGAGAVSGAGEGRGNRAQSAALGALAGGATGGLVGGAIVSAPVVAQYAKVLFNNGQSVTREAISQITSALKRDGFDVTSPTGVQKLKNALQEYTGKPVSLADIGASTRARTGVGLRAPSEQQQIGIDTVMSRQAGQANRLARDVRETVAPRTDVHAIDDDLVAQRAEEAQKLRDLALFEDGPEKVRLEERVFKPIPLSPEVQAKADAFAAENETNAEATAEAIARELEDMRLVPGFENHPVSINEVQGLVLDDMGIARDAPGALEFVRDVFNRTNSKLKFPPREIKEAGGRQSRIVDDSTLQQLARLPMAQKALQGAKETANAERLLLDAQGLPSDHLPYHGDASQLDMRAFDYLKRYLDDEVNLLYKRGQSRSFTAGEAAQVKQLRDTIREQLRSYNPQYADYLDAYKGSSEMIDALRSGREFDRLDPEQIAAEQAGRSTAGQELFRVGTARNLLDTIKSARGEGAVPANRILNSPEEREQLAATGVSPENFNTLTSRVGQERNMSLLTRELQGSQTAQRQAAQLDAEGGGPIVPFNPSSGFGWAGAIIRSVANKTSTQRNAAVNEALLPRLLSQDPKVIESTITELEKAGQVALARQIKRSLAARRAGAYGGLAIGSPVALPEER